MQMSWLDYAWFTVNNCGCKVNPWMMKGSEELWRSEHYMAWCYMAWFYSHISCISWHGFLIFIARSDKDVDKRHEGVLRSNKIKEFVRKTKKVSQIPRKIKKEYKTIARKIKKEFKTVTTQTRKAFKLEDKSLWPVACRVDMFISPSHRSNFMQIQQMNKFSLDTTYSTLCWTYDISIPTRICFRDRLFAPSF